MEGKNKQDFHASLPEKSQRDVESAKWVFFLAILWFFSSALSAIGIIFTPAQGFELPLAVFFYVMTGVMFGLFYSMEIRKVSRFFFWGFVFYGGLTFGPLGISWILIKIFGINVAISVIFALFFPSIFSFVFARDLYQQFLYLKKLQGKKPHRISSVFFGEIFSFSVLATLGLILILLGAYPTVDSWEIIVEHFTAMQVFALFLVVSIIFIFLDSWLYIALSKPSMRKAKFDANLTDKVDILELAKQLRRKKIYDVEFSLLGGWIRWVIITETEQKEFFLNTNGEFHVALEVTQDIEGSSKSLEKELAKKWKAKNVRCEIGSKALWETKKSIVSFFKIPGRIVAVLGIFSIFWILPISLVTLLRGTSHELPWDFETVRVILFISLAGIGVAFSQLIISTTALAYKSKKNVAKSYARRNVTFISLMTLSFGLFATGMTRVFLEIPVLQLIIVFILLYNFFDNFRNDSLLYRAICKATNLPLSLIKVGTTALVVILPFLFDTLDVYLNFVLLPFWLFGLLATLHKAPSCMPFRRFVFACERLGERPDQEYGNVPDWLGKPLRRRSSYYASSASYTIYSAMFSGVLTGFITVMKEPNILLVPIIAIAAFLIMRIFIDACCRKILRR